MSDVQGNFEDDNFEGSKVDEDISRPSIEEEIKGTSCSNGDAENETGTESITLRSLMENICQLRLLFEQRLLYDKSKEEAFGRLYEELTELKRNATFEKNKPLFLDLVFLYDRMEVIEQGLTESEQARDALESLKSELVEVLNRHEVYQIESKPTEFDPKWQNAVQAEKVDCREDGARVIRVLRRGFRYRERLLRSEEVVVGRPDIKSNSG